MVHLHCRSAFSLLKSTLRIDDIVQASVQAGLEAAVLSDYNVMYGTMEFYHACKKAGIRPIFGMETRGALDQKEYALLLLAKNDAGLQELYALATRLSKEEGLPDLEMLSGQVKNCFVILLGIGDEIERNLMYNHPEAIEKDLAQIKDLFQDSLAMAMAMSDSRLRKEHNALLKTIAAGLNLPAPAVSYILYKEAQDVELLKILRAIERGTIASDQRLDVRMQRHFRSPADMQGIYAANELEASQAIADACQVEMAFEKSGLPVFENKLGIDSAAYLKKLCHAGLKKRLDGNISDVYARRLAYELETITRMGFVDYFLIVWDFIRFARSRNILVGPGRGSAAGSVVAWCLGITHIDPVANNLLFERFLNPERISLPDIDTDVADDRREEVIAYLHETYGHDRVAQIVTFSNMKARSVLRDVGKALTYPIRTVDTLCRLIPNTPGMNLSLACQQVPAFARMVNQDKSIRRLYEICLKLEGLPRHTSIHAAGVVLSSLPIVQVCPLLESDTGAATTQFTMEYLEELGLIKMDVLALRNLSTIAQVQAAIEESTGTSLDLNRLPLNDPAVYALLKKADTLGVFQLESDGIKQLILQMQPENFEDISQIIALYRPGPMANIQTFLERRAHPEKTVYLHPILEPILKDTCGIIVYQEQTMQIAQAAAGFTMAQADLLRKAMSKKKKDVMDAFASQFIGGAKEKGMDENTAITIFSWMERFADYGFNKSHSYAYGLIVYQMAWLKAHYPLFFYQALLNSVIGSAQKTSQYLHECQRRQIPILPADIRFSGGEWTLENGALRLPLSAIKGVGKAIYSKILAERETRPYDNLYDLLARLEILKVPESILITLIDAGALDGFELSRAVLKKNLPRILEYCRLIRVDSQQVLFDYDIVSRPVLKEASQSASQIIENEFNAYGFYLSGHPAEKLRRRYFSSLPNIAATLPKNGPVGVVGRIAKMNFHKTKRQELMCFLVLEDESQSIDIAIMPELLTRIRSLLAVGKTVFVKGKKDRPSSILAYEIQVVKEE